MENWGIAPHLFSQDGAEPRAGVTGITRRISARLLPPVLSILPTLHFIIHTASCISCKNDFQGYVAGSSVIWQALRELKTLGPDLPPPGSLFPLRLRTCLLFGLDIHAAFQNGDRRHLPRYHGGRYYSVSATKLVPIPGATPAHRGQ